jgi:hypothetical protein
MAHPYHHALSSVRKWGGDVADYLPLHSWFDQSKAIEADFRHRALRHHAEGIFMLETIFGPTLTLSTSKVIHDPLGRRAACQGRSWAHPVLCGLGEGDPPAAVDGPRPPHRGRGRVAVYRVEVRRTGGDR